MKKEQKYYVKALTALEPGRLVFRTIRIFNNPGKADEWLMNYVRMNHRDMRDYTISTKPDKV